MEAFIGFDGKPYSIGDKIQVNPDVPGGLGGATGVVIGCRPTPKDRVRVVLDGHAGIKFAGSEDTFKSIS